MNAIIYHRLNVGPLLVAQEMEAAIELAAQENDLDAHELAARFLKDARQVLKEFARRMKTKKPAARNGDNSRQAR